MKAKTPVYIEDIAEGWVTDTQAKVLSTIQANETTALGTTLITQIRYSKSSFDELIETLAQADGGGQERYKKYPTVHMVQDITINRGEDVGLFGSFNLNFIIMHQTEQTYKIDDRDRKVFKPVLWPIYYEFLNQIAKSGWVFGSNETTGEFKHQVIKRAFWGNRNLQGSASILNDYVDALEVKNLIVKINYSNC